MGKKDYSKFREITIREDLPIKFISGEYNKDIYDVFEKINIKTLKDLFTAYDNGYFNDKRKRFNIEIKGQIELLMAYYMNTPLIASGVLNKRVNMQSHDTINELYENYEFRNELKRVGISKAEFIMLYQYCMNRQGHISTYEDGTLSIMHIIQKFIDDKEYQSGITATTPSYNQSDILVIQNLKFKAELYERYLGYEKQLEQYGTGYKNVNGAVDFGVIQELEKQMKFLLKARNNLDAQIEWLQSQLTNVRNAGGIRK